MKKLLIGLLAICSLTSFANEAVREKGSVLVESNLLTEGNIKLTISGKAAKAVFEKTVFNDVQGPGSLSGMEIRQNENLVCIKHPAKGPVRDEVNCEMILERQGGLPVKLPRTYLNL